MNYRTIIFVSIMFFLAPVHALEGNVQAGKAKSGTCVACHQVDGNSSSSIYPKIAGQHASYSAKQIHNIKKNEGRTSPIMMPMVQGLTDQDIADLAAYFSSQKIKTGETDKKYLELGGKIFRAGNPKTGVPACAGCHSPRGLGNGPALFPALAGQHADYTIQQLNNFAKNIRVNDPNGIMRDIASKMTAAEIEAVAHFIQGLHSEGE